MLPMALPPDAQKQYDRVEADVVGWMAQRAANDAEFLASIADLDPAAQEQARAERGRDAAYRAAQAETLVKMEQLKQVAAAGKLDAVKQWAADFLESGEKLVVFAWHTAVVDEFAREFGAPSITGQTPLVARQAAVDRFQTDPECKVIVCNIQAGGVGITLTASSNVLFVEYPWNPGLLDQAADRTHRIGQHYPVTIWQSVAAGTVEEDILETIGQKRSVIVQATDAQGEGAGAGSVMNEVVRRLLERRQQKGV